MLTTLIALLSLSVPLASAYAPGLEFVYSLERATQGISTLSRRLQVPLAAVLHDRTAPGCRASQR